MARVPYETQKPSAGETIVEAVRRQLLDAILFGDLARPARLFPADLAARLGVSITPIREALAGLASEGFIEAVPRRGYHVRRPAAGYMTELWSVRLALELMAGETFIDRVADISARRTALAPLIELHRKLVGYGARGHRDHLALNGRFHDTLVELSGNSLLVSTYGGIRVRLLVAWVQRGSQAWRPRLPSEQAEHEAILAALKAGDKSAFDAALRRHLARSLHDVMADLREMRPAITDQEGSDETTRHDSQRRSGVAAGHVRHGGARRAADNNSDVDLPEPHRNQPARSRAGRNH